MSWALLAVAHAAVLEVSADGAYTTVQEAIDAAQDGDEVQVAAGTYAGGIDFLGKDLVVVGVDGPEATILDVGDVSGLSGIRATRGEPLTATLQGFTVVRGHGTELIWVIGTGWMGGGVVVQNAGLTVRDCVFSENKARHSGQSGGGAVAVFGGELRVQESTFRENLGFYAGGGILAVESEVWVEDSVFEANLARHGGGLAAFQDAAIHLVGNRWVGNTAGRGGAVFLRESTLDASGEVFDENVAWHVGGALATETGDAVVSESRFVGNRAADDGGHLHIARDSVVEVLSSWLEGGRATAGGAVFLRGRASELLAEGLVLVDNSAGESGGDFWIGQGTAELAHTTSVRPTLGAQAPGASIFATAGAVVEALNLVLTGGVGGSAWFAGGTAQLSVSDALIFDFVGQQGNASAEGVSELDPLLADLSEGAVDPSLQAGSPAIDAGQGVDLDGSAADLGATGGLRPWTP